MSEFDTSGSVEIRNSVIPELKITDRGTRSANNISRKICPGAQILGPRNPPGPGHGGLVPGIDFRTPVVTLLAITKVPCKNSAAETPRKILKLQKCDVGST